MERPSIAAAAFDRPGVRVRTLAVLRWIAIGGQFVTLIIVGLYLGYPLLWPSLVAAVGASAVLNIGLVTLYGRNARLQGRDLALHLAFDLVQAGVLLFLTGGLANPPSPSSSSCRSPLLPLCCRRGRWRRSAPSR